MTVRDFIELLHSKIANGLDPESEVYVSNHGEERALNDDDLAYQQSVMDADEGEEIEGDFLIITSWS
jgi:hypothetical protein